MLVQRRPEVVGCARCDDRARPDLRRWLHCWAAGWRDARGHRFGIECTAHRRELPHVLLTDPHNLDLTTSEAVRGHPHNGVGDVDVGGAADDHVVDDARPTPAVPRRDADEAWWAPPRDDGFAPGEGRPAEGTAEAHGHAAPEEDHERGRVDRPDDDRA